MGTSVQSDHAPAHQLASSASSASSTTPEDLSETTYSAIPPRATAIMYGKSPAACSASSARRDPQVGIEKRPPEHADCCSREERRALDRRQCQQIVGYTAGSTKACRGQGSAPASHATNILRALPKRNHGSQPQEEHAVELTPRAAAVNVLLHHLQLRRQAACRVSTFLYLTLLSSFLPNHVIRQPLSCTAAATLSISTLRVTGKLDSSTTQVGTGTWTPRKGERQD
eukprot:scaffold3619_cov328-Prasinococcus_capsulatus_cf.AAC.2